MRYKVLDSWRGIAALLVAVFHFPVSGYVHNAVLVRHAYLFVDFFFLLSGFVIAHSLRDGLAGAGDFRAFMWRRLGRVYPLYAVVLFAFVAVEFIKLAALPWLHVAPQTAPFAAGSYSDPNVLSLHFTMMQVFGLDDGLSWNWPDWSIAAEVWTYAVFGLICLLAYSHRRAVLCTLCAMALVVLLEWSNRGIEVTYDLGFVRCLYGFTAGALVYEIYTRLPFALSGLMATVSEWVAVVLALAFVAISGRNVTSFAAPAVFGFLVLVFAFEGGALSRALRGGIFQALGDLSYSIYIVHALVVLLFTSMSSLLLSHSMVAVWRVETYDGINERILNVTGQGVSDLLTVGYVAVVLVLAVIGWRLVEKPSRTAVNAWAQARPQPQGIPA